MTTPPAVDIIIVTHNTRNLTIECVASVATHPPETPGDIFVVDNASVDGTLDEVRSLWPGIRTIALRQNVGFGAANNIALRMATAPLVLLLNSDALLNDGVADRLVDRLLQRNAVAAGPRLVDAGGRPELSFGPMLSPFNELAQRVRGRLAARPGRLARALTEHRLRGERYVEWVSGACLLLRREAALAVGFFDERYFLYEEDVDLCAALRAAGGRILYTPAAEVIHRRGGSASTSTGSLEHYDRSHLAFYEKHAPGWAPWLRRWLRWRGRPVR